MERQSENTVMVSEADVTAFGMQPQSDYKIDIQEVVLIDGTDVKTYWLGNIHKDVITVGRKEQNDIIVEKNFISGIHVSIYPHDGYVSIVDQNSTNGTFLCQGSQYHQLQPGVAFNVVKNNTIIRLGRDANQFAFLIFSQKDARAKWNVVPFEQEQLTIGRSDQSDICLAKVAVSRQHARIQRNGDTYEVVDLNSTNGVFVNGQMVCNRQELHNLDVLYIAGCILIFTQRQIVYKIPVEGVSLELRALTKTVSRDKVILNNVSLEIEPNEFVAIIGGSGAGKSTLMTAMSGFDKKVQGKVYFNNLDLYANFSGIKNIIGFVPQQDIIYENLTLRKMLYYTAKMKMPSDIANTEIEKRINQVLEMVELSEHQSTYIRKLSGGQKKRASIAVELLSDPKLFFLDEPTSGLDPGTERNLMYTLRALAKQQGKTIVMVTHTTQNLNLCDKIIIMGSGGRLCYCGRPDGALDFFGVNSLVDVYDLATHDSQTWAERFAQCQREPLQTEESGGGGTSIRNRNYSLLKQLQVLTVRYFELIKNDWQRLVLLFLQPLLIGLLLMSVAGEDVFDVFEDTKSILFALTCSGIWIGLFNTIQEICKERVILKREYMSNLNLGVYILSKCIVQGCVCVLQSAILLGCFIFTVGMPVQGILFDEPVAEMYLTLFLTIYASASLGLIVSALSKNADRAMAVAPFLLIIQLLFSGILFELEGITDFISRFTISRWSIECLGSIADLNALTMKIQKEIPQVEHKASELFEFAASHLIGDWMILFMFIILFATISGVVLRNLSNEQR